MPDVSDLSVFQEQPGVFFTRFLVAADSQGGVVRIAFADAVTGMSGPVRAHVVGRTSDLIALHKILGEVLFQGKDQAGG